MEKYKAALLVILFIVLTFLATTSKFVWNSHDERGNFGIPSYCEYSGIWNKLLNVRWVISGRCSG